MAQEKLKLQITLGYQEVLVVDDQLHIAKVMVALLEGTTPEERKEDALRRDLEAMTKDRDYYSRRHTEQYEKLKELEKFKKAVEDKEAAMKEVMDKDF